jgi:hypothetical protein
MKLHVLLLFTSISCIAHTALPLTNGCLQNGTAVLPYVSPPTIKPSSHPTIKPFNNPATKLSSPPIRQGHRRWHVRQPLPPIWARYAASVNEPTRANVPQRSGRQPSNHPAIQQSDSLPPTAILHHHIDSFYAEKTQWQLLEFKNSKKGEWLKFLPNLGITYTVNGRPRPGISLSSGILYQAQKAKQTRAAKRRQIIETNRLEAEREKSKLKELLLRHQLLAEELTRHRSLHQVDAQLFTIREAEYQRQERAPSDYLQAKRTFLLQQQALREKEGQLQLLKLEILSTAHLK